MQADAIIAAFRTRADDAVEPYLVSDEDALGYIAEAESEAAIRGRLLYDDTTTAIVQLAISANQSDVPLDPRIWMIDAATFTPTSGGRAQLLDAKGVDWLREAKLGCAGSSFICSYPDAFAHVSRTLLRLWPAPTGAGTLNLAVYRTPLTPVAATRDQLEIAAEHHAGLVDWMLYRAYGNKDSELHDDDRSKLALGEFTVRFGERDSASVTRARNERRRVTTVCI